MTRSFETLSRDAQRRRLRRHAFSFADRYELDASGLRLVQFEDNAVYRIATAGGDYMLRLSVQNGRTLLEQRSEVAWLSSLSAEPGLAVPIPHGPVLSEDIDGWREPATAALFNWVPGHKLGGDQHAARPLGVVVSLLHQNARSFEPGTEFERPSWGLDDVFDQGAALTHPLAAERLTDSERQVLEHVAMRARDKTPAQNFADWGMTHADLHVGNVIQADAGYLAVIDFDDCGWGYYALDIATVLSSVFRRKTIAEYQVFAEEFIAGYLSVSALPPGVAAFDEFLVMRDTIILNFILGSSNEAVAGWGYQRVAGILELMRIYLSSGQYPGRVDSLSTDLVGVNA